MVVRSPFWCVAWLVSLILVLGTQTADGAELRAGAHAEPISPSKFPAPVNGGMKGNFATTVQDHMHARSLAISNGSEAVILCVVDACMIPRDICETAKEIVASKTGVARANLLISATHTHSAATLTPVFQSDPDPEYVSTVGERVAQGMIRAYENLEPAEIGWAKGSDPSQVFNRRWFLKPGKTYENPFGVTTDRVQMNPGYMNADVDRPSGPVDPDVWLLVARSKSDQRPIALFANYSLHYVGNVPPISADYFAEFAEQIGERLKANDARYEGKPPFVGIMSNGTSGNINNVNYAAAESPRRMPGEQIVVVAKSVADVAQQAYATIEFHSDAAIQCREADLQLGVRKPSPEDIQTAQRTLETSTRSRWAVLGSQGNLCSRDSITRRVSGGGSCQTAGVTHRGSEHHGDSLRSVRRDWPRAETEIASAEPIHDLFSQWLQRVSANGSAPRVGWL